MENEKNVVSTKIPVKAEAPKRGRKPTEKAKPTKTAKAEKKATEPDKIVLQIAGREDVDVNAVMAAAKSHYSKAKKKSASNVVLYIKPDEGVAYYTVNGKGSDDFKVDL